MRSYIYYFFNLLVIVPPLLISIFSDVKTYKQWRAWGISLLLVSIPFIIWDIWAAANSHWFFSSIYTVSQRIFGLPVEEILFFITVPLAMCFVWDVLKKHIPSKDISEIAGVVMISLLALVSLVLLFTQFGRAYSRSAALASLIAIALIIATRWWRRNLFWWFQLFLIGIFFIANTFLTALPVITYGDSSYIGFRVGTIPIEDFFFNFALINLFVIIYERYSKT
jgi:lycopene cyclase domain-containing protein